MRTKLSYTLALLVLVLGVSGCHRPPKGPKVLKDAVLTMTLIVDDPTPPGKDRRVSLHIEPAMELKDTRVNFYVPANFKVKAGFAGRIIPQLHAGQSSSQEVLITGSGGGSLLVRLSGTNEKGMRFNRSLDYEL